MPLRRKDTDLDIAPNYTYNPICGFIVIDKHVPILPLWRLSGCSLVYASSDFKKFFDIWLDTISRLIYSLYKNLVYTIAHKETEMNIKGKKISFNICPLLTEKYKSQERNEVQASLWSIFS